jgi:outer membrane lipoprotein-sorting protein
MRYAFFSALAMLLLCGSFVTQTSGRPAAQPAAQKMPGGDRTSEEVIRKFAEKESEFYDAWMQYTYTQTALIRVLSVNGAPQKESMTIISEVVFKDDGTRSVRHSRSGQLRSVNFTDEDQDIIDNLNPFALTTKNLPLYDLQYQGKEKTDELECYVFSIKPKSIQKKKFYFEGKIWVDDRDFQVVKTLGKAVPQSKDKQFPEFETIRQIIDGKYWFPTWTHADSTLDFPGNRVRIEETITYGNYKKFASKATIRYPDSNQ